MPASVGSRWPRPPDAREPGRFHPFAFEPEPCPPVAGEGEVKVLERPNLHDNGREVGAASRDRLVVGRQGVSVASLDDRARRRLRAVADAARRPRSVPGPIGDRVRPVQRRDALGPNLKLAVHVVGVQRDARLSVEFGELVRAGVAVEAKRPVSPLRSSQYDGARAGTPVQAEGREGRRVKGRTAVRHASLEAVPDPGEDRAEVVRPVLPRRAPHGAPSPFAPPDRARSRKIRARLRR